MSNEHPQIVILSGGCSSEREVSLVSGRCLHEGLSKAFATDLRVIDEETLPGDLDPAQQVIFPALHGGFGEDGRLQDMLEQAGFAYAGSDARASRLCMDKVATKEEARKAGLLCTEEFTFQAPDNVPEATGVIDRLGEALVCKPVDQGSSVGLYLTEGKQALSECLKALNQGRWMIEPRLKGREITVGVVGGKALGTVEIVPTGGVYDFEHKYTPGHTEYRVPAPLEPEEDTLLRQQAEAIFEACGCRDFARVDFIFIPQQGAYFLEINTIPGLTQTSLLPKCASCSQMDFETLCQQLVKPAINRFQGGVLASPNPKPAKL